MACTCDMVTAMCGVCGLLEGSFWVESLPWVVQRASEGVVVGVVLVRTRSLKLDSVPATNDARLR
jgi:hypothetical protein